MQTRDTDWKSIEISPERNQQKSRLLITFSRASYHQVGTAYPNTRKDHVVLMAETRKLCLYLYRRGSVAMVTRYKIRVAPTSSAIEK